MLIFSDTNAWQTLFLEAKKTGTAAGIIGKYTVENVELQSTEGAAKEVV